MEGRVNMQRRTGSYCGHCIMLRQLQSNSLHSVATEARDMCDYYRMSGDKERLHPRLYKEEGCDACGDAPHCQGAGLILGKSLLDVVALHGDSSSITPWYAEPAEAQAGPEENGRGRGWGMVADKNMRSC